MSVTSPPRPPRSSDPVDRGELEALVEALIEEARQRARRRRRKYGAAMLLGATIIVGAIVGLSRGAAHATQTSSAADGPSASQTGLPNGEIAVTRFGNVSHVVLWTRRGVRDLGIEGRAYGWSPDGSRLVVQRSSNLYVVRADGSDATLVARRADGWNVAWSPDGTKIAFEHRPHTPSSSSAFQSLDVVNADGTGWHQIASQALSGGWFSGNLAWSPDGSQVLFAGRTSAYRQQGLFLVPADGSAPPRPVVIHARVIRPSQPAWSPDGTRIAFVGSERPGGVYGGIYVMKADGSAVRHVAAGHGPVWSPDGSKIALRGNGNQTVHADGTHLVRLSHGGGWVGLTWSPDGRELAEVSRIQTGRGGDVWIVRADGSHPVRIVHTPHVYYGFPLWRNGTATTES
jgi:Tol biopolymer transport system component